MNVRVLFFGQTAEVAGFREVELKFETPPTGNQAFAAVLDKFPRLNDSKLLFAINQEYAKGEEIIADGDELAVFTAVSGG